MACRTHSLRSMEERLSSNLLLHYSAFAHRVFGAAITGVRQRI